MKEVCKKWCVLGCVNTKCKAQSKFALRSEFTQRKYQRYQTFNRMNYFINLEDPNLKNLSNWKVIQYKSKHLHSESLGFQLNPHGRVCVFCFLEIPNIEDYTCAWFFMHT